MPSNERAPDLVLPPDWQAALAIRGWNWRASNDSYLFLTKPGYMLRLFRFPARPQDAFDATVMPEDTPEGPAAAPVAGKRARQRALDLARTLWQEHEGYLQELGIQLSGVGVLQFRSMKAPAVQKTASANEGVKTEPVSVPGQRVCC